MDSPGIKARHPQRGRVRAQGHAPGTQRAPRAYQGKANIQLESAEKSGKQVIVAENVSLRTQGGPP